MDDLKPGCETPQPVSFYIVEAAAVALSSKEERAVQRKVWSVFYYVTAAVVRCAQVLYTENRQHDRAPWNLTTLEMLALDTMPLHYCNLVPSGWAQDWKKMHKIPIWHANCSRGHICFSCSNGWFSRPHSNRNMNPGSV